MQDLNFWTILSLVLLGLSTVFGSYFVVFKSKARQLYNLGKEALDVAKAAIDALEDNKITPEEVAKIKKEAVELQAAWRLLKAKKE